jgi:high-affinity iron transporter
MARYTHCFGVLVLVAVGIACVAGEAQREAVGEHRRAGTSVVRSDDLSVPALVITFRESVEGCVIVSVLLNMLHKAGMNESKKWVWVGTAIALLMTIVCGAICITIWYTIQRNMPTVGRVAFEAVLATIACSVLTLMAFKFLRLKDIIIKWEGKLFKKGEAATEGEGEGEGEGVEKPKMSWWQQFRDAMNIKHQAIGDAAEVSARSIIILTISAIFREGLETVIFLLPMSTTSTELGLVKGAAAGFAAGFAFGILVLVVGKYALTNVMWFFNLTTAFIFFIAGGLANYALIEYEQIGTTSIKPRNDPWLLRPVYNIGCKRVHPEVPVRCFLDETTGAGLAFRSLLGVYVSSCYYPWVFILVDVWCVLDETAGACLALRSLLNILLLCVPLPLDPRYTAILCPHTTRYVSWGYHASPTMFHPVSGVPRFLI